MMIDATPLPEPLPAPAPGERWNHVRRLLAVRLDNLGDILMTTPALAALRERFPAARLTLLGSPAAAAMAGHLPIVDDIWTFAAPWMRAGLPAAEEAATLGRAEAALVDRLSLARFDAVVIFTVCTQSALPVALLCRLAGIPLRLAHCRENPYALLTDWVPETDVVGSGMRHEVERQLALVAAVGAITADDRLRFTVLEADRHRLAARLTPRGLAPGRAYAVLHPGATAPSRRWPAERFGAVAALLTRSPGCAVVFSGDGGDLALVEQAGREMAVSTPLAFAAAAATLRQAGPALPPAPTPVASSAASSASASASASASPSPSPSASASASSFASSAAPATVADVVAGAPAPAVSLAGELSLGEFAALLEGASVLVANNSAPAHLAAALGTPVVDLYALTNPQHTPWRVAARVLSHDVPCRWCLKSSCPQPHHPCLRGIGAEEVAAAARALIDGDARRASQPAATDPPSAPSAAAPIRRCESADPSSATDAVAMADASTLAAGFAAPADPAAGASAAARLPGTPSMPVAGRPALSAISSVIPSAIPTTPLLEHFT